MTTLPLDILLVNDYTGSMQQIKNAIILLGGSGTRLLVEGAPSVVNKHLHYLHGKLIVDYSLDTLQSLGCRNVSVILGGEHFGGVASYLQDGSRYGMSLNYVFQGEPKGIAHAINLCRRYVADEDVFAVMLGDSFFNQPVAFNPIIPNQAQVILHQHPQLKRFGVASLSNRIITRIEEKPKTLDCTVDQYAITGCYLFDRQFFNFFERTKPSERGEYEITSIIQQYLDIGSLGYSIYQGTWSDLGTHESLQAVQHLLYKEHQ